MFRSRRALRPRPRHACRRDRRWRRAHPGNGRRRGIAPRIHRPCMRWPCVLAGRRRPAVRRWRDRQMPARGDHDRRQCGDESRLTGTPGPGPDPSWHNAHRRAACRRGERALRTRLRKDGFYPFGRGSMLEVAMISAHAAHLTTNADLDFALRAVTEAPAQTMRLSDYGLRPGARADLQLLPVPTWSEALRLQPLPEEVWFRGRLVAENSVRSTIHRVRPPSASPVRGPVSESRGRAE